MIASLILSFLWQLVYYNCMEVVTWLCYHNKTWEKWYLPLPRIHFNYINSKFHLNLTNSPYVTENFFTKIWLKTPSDQKGKNNGVYRIFLDTQYSRNTYVRETWQFIPICSKLSIISLMTSSWKWIKHSPITITVFWFSLKWCKGYNWVNLAIVWLFWNKFGIFRKKNCEN